MTNFVRNIASRSPFFSCLQNECLSGVDGEQGLYKVIITLFMQLPNPPLSLLKIDSQSHCSFGVCSILVKPSSSLLRFLSSCTSNLTLVTFRASL